MLGSCRECGRKLSYSADRCPSCRSNAPIISGSLGVKDTLVWLLQMLGICVVILLGMIVVPIAMGVDPAVVFEAFRLPQK